GAAAVGLTEDRRPKTEDRRPKTEDRKQSAPSLSETGRFVFGRRSSVQSPVPSPQSPSVHVTCCGSARSNAEPSATQPTNSAAPIAIAGLALKAYHIAPPTPTGMSSISACASRFAITVRI